MAAAAPGAVPLPRPYIVYELGKRKFEVDSRYIDLRPIGRGSHGLVAHAVDAFTGRKVAIKRVARMFDDPVDATRVLHEIKALRHFGRHDNLVEIFDVMTSPPETEDFHTVYIVTSLFECDLERIVSSSQKLTDQHAQYFTYQILRGLKYMHSAGLVHGILNPSHLLVNSNCDLAICNFAETRSTAPAAWTDYSYSRWYTAPEMACELPVYHNPAAADMWAVGCILAEIICRRPFFRGSSTREQLELIVTKLGVAEEDLAEMDICKPALEHIRRVAPDPARVQPWDKLLPTGSPLALDLISKLLVFNPAKRISVEEALAHPYLESLRKGPLEPSCPRPFDFSFEQDYPEGIPQYQLQRLVYEEMCRVRVESEGEIAAILRARAEMKMKEEAKEAKEAETAAYKAALRAKLG